MDLVSLIGRILFGGFFLLSGVNHFLNLAAYSGYAASKGVPAASLGVIGSGLLLAAGGTLVLAGWKVRWGAWMIVVFLIPTTLMMHAFWRVSDPQLAQAEMVNFTKNVALLGAALIIAAAPGWPYAAERRREPPRT